MSRFCHWLSKKRDYQRKLEYIPFLFKYSCLALSFSSSVGAVLYFVYNSLATKASNFYSNSLCISGNKFFCSKKKYFVSAIKSSCEICTFFISIHSFLSSSPQVRKISIFCNLASLHFSSPQFQGCKISISCNLAVFLFCNIIFHKY